MLSTTTLNPAAPAKDWLAARLDRRPLLVSRPNRSRPAGGSHNQRLKLTGAAILVFRASTSHGRPRQLTRTFGHKEVRKMSRRCLVAVCGVGMTLTVGDGLLHAAEPMQVETSYYLGESKMTTPDGKLIRTSL